MQRNNLDSIEGNLKIGTIFKIHYFSTG